MNKILIDLRRALKKAADPKTKESSKRFFKEKIDVYGVGTGIVQKMSKEYFQKVRELPKKDLFDLCEDLFASGKMEESWIAANWAEGIHKSFTPEDFKTFERWIDSYITNWASCDTFCNHTVGDFIDMYPQYVQELKKWAKSKNRWMKRAAAVSLILPARKGGFLKDVFEMADILLLDEDDMVQKGYGWMLKEASRKHQKEVFNYVVKHKSIMPRTALRYAIEKMPEDLRKKAMAK